MYKNVFDVTLYYIFNDFIGQNPPSKLEGGSKHLICCSYDAELGSIFKLCKVNNISLANILLFFLKTTISSSTYYVCLEKRETRVVE